MPYGLMNRIPYKLPANIAPPGTRCIQITIPDDDEWENDLFSLISAEFGRWLMWDRDVGKNGTKVAGRWRAALKTWKHCEKAKSAGSGVELPGMSDLIDVSCGPDGKCRLGYRCEVCGDFHYVQDANNPPSVTPPTPQPDPGGCATFDMIVHANAQYLSGVQVSTGDVITVTGLTGAWNDGGTLTWWCPTGFEFALGFCDGAIPAPVTGTDPLVASKHMILIAFDGTNYYDATAPFTINPGVTLQNLVFQANDSALGNNSGDVLGHVQVCKSMTPPAPDGVYWSTNTNNAPVTYPTWTHIPFGTSVHLTSTTPNNLAYIDVTYVTGGFDVHGQPVHRAQVCFNIAALTLTGFTGYAPNESYTPCIACVPQSPVVSAGPPSTIPGEYADGQWASTTPYTIDLVITAC
jgi:hypothetical protein